MLEILSSEEWEIKLEALELADDREELDYDLQNKDKQLESEINIIEKMDTY